MRGEEGKERREGKRKRGMDKKRRERWNEGRKEENRRMETVEKEGRPEGKRRGQQMR